MKEANAKDDKKVPNLKVKIKKQYSRSLPFGRLQSRNGLAIVMSFYGNPDVVSDLMQTCNH